MFFLDQIETLAIKLSGLAWVMLGVWGITNQQLALYAAIVASLTTIGLNAYKFYKEIKKKKNDVS
jgi:hypothetical protein